MVTKVSQLISNSQLPLVDIMQLDIDPYALWHNGHLGFNFWHIFIACAMVMCSECGAERIGMHCVK